MSLHLYVFFNFFEQCFMDFSHTDFYLKKEKNERASKQASKLASSFTSNYVNMYFKYVSQFRA